MCSSEIKKNNYCKISYVRGVHLCLNYGRKLNKLQLSSIGVTVITLYKTSGSVMWFVEVHIGSNGHNPKWVNVQVAFLDKSKKEKESIIEIT